MARTRGRGSLDFQWSEPESRSSVEYPLGKDRRRVAFRGPKGRGNHRSSTSSWGTNWCRRKSVLDAKSGTIQRKDSVGTANRMGKTMRGGNGLTPGPERGIRTGGVPQGQPSWVGPIRRASMWRPNSLRRQAGGKGTVEKPRCDGGKTPERAQPSPYKMVAMRQTVHGVLTDNRGGGGPANPGGSTSGIMREGCRARWEYLSSHRTI